MRYDIVTLFPEMFASFFTSGLIQKALARDLIEVRTSNPRACAEDKHRTVDDTPYGGGSGMVMMPGPILDAMEGLDKTTTGAPAHRILLTPQGAPFTQRDAERLSQKHALMLVCGRYEGVDERVRSFMDEELSLGDFVLLGGEVAAMAVIEATARLVPKVLGNASSKDDESHVQGLLEYPQYTRPLSFRGVEVPEVLLSGHHAAIATWRRKQSLARTKARRPDLLARLDLTATDQALLEEIDHEEKGAPKKDGDAT